MSTIISLVIMSMLYGVTGNTQIPKPSCDASKEVSVRYSSTSQRIYVESLDGTRGGCTSLSHVYETLGADSSPLYPLETEGEWYLGNELYVLDGITLEVRGTSDGGDCDYLKLKSDGDGFVYIRGHGASLDFVNTKVTSWDISKGDVDIDLSDGRAYLSAISEVLIDESETCVGVAKSDMGEARMDIEETEVAYLGYKASESWGVSWKIRGLCNDLSNEDDYEGLGVYGNIIDSDLHHMYYGHYSYGHLNGVFTGNNVHDNVVYGFDPHHGSTELTISDNEVYNNGNHGIIFSKWCSDALVENNHVHDNVGVGIFAHWVGDGATIAGNLVEDNGDSGIAFLESSDGLVYNNVIKRNSHGIRFSVGSRDNVVLENTFEDNSGYDVYTYEGSDPVVEVPDKELKNNVFFKNTFSGNTEGFRFDGSVGSQFVDNDVMDAETFEVNESDGLLLTGNEFPEEMEFDVSGSCLEETGSSPCGDTPMTVFTTADARRVLQDIDDEEYSSTSEEVFGTDEFATPTHISLFTASPTPGPSGDNTAETSSPTVYQNTNMPTASPSSTGFFSVQPTVATGRGIFIDSSDTWGPAGSPTGSPTDGAPIAGGDDDSREVPVDVDSGATRIGKFSSQTLIVAGFVVIVGQFFV